MKNYQVWTNEANPKLQLDRLTKREAETTFNVLLVAGVETFITYTEPNAPKFYKRLELTE